jgi:hypothetical protein
VRVAAAVSITGVSVVDIDPDRTALDLSARSLICRLPLAARSM